MALLTGAPWAQAQDADELPRKVVDLPLGEAGPGLDGYVDQDAQAYLDKLKLTAYQRFAVLSLKQRFAILAHDAWRAEPTADRILEAIAASTGPKLASELWELRKNAKGLDLVALSEQEALWLRTGIEESLAAFETARVVAQGATSATQWNEAAGMMQPALVGAADLGFGDVVGVLRRGPMAGEASGLTKGLKVLRSMWRGSHTVRLKGRAGVWQVSSAALLIETPVIQEQGRIYRNDDGSYTFGTKQGLRLLPQGGADAPDPALDALKRLAESGESDPVTLNGVKREIGNQKPWLSVFSFEELPDDDSLGEGAPQPSGSPSRGVVDALGD
ncbi:MAG: hypothetical protein KDD82_18940 [Planctomycetes bacterium]|nr:hypothetical protein [Planctomycetota bacterium]